MSLCYPGQTSTTSTSPTWSLSGESGGQPQSKISTRWVTSRSPLADPAVGLKAPHTVGFQRWTPTHHPRARGRDSRALAGVVPSLVFPERRSAAQNVKGRRLPSVEMKKVGRPGRKGSPVRGSEAMVLPCPCRKPGSVPSRNCRSISGTKWHKAVLALYARISEN